MHNDWSHCPAFSRRLDCFPLWNEAASWILSTAPLHLYIDLETYTQPGDRHFIIQVASSCARS